MKKIKPENIKRVVVRGTNWVGDAVMTIPALRELRRVLPEARITLCTRSWSRGIFADADFIDDILTYDKRGGAVKSLLDQSKEWRRNTFDLAVLFQNAFEAALLAALGRARYRVGYATDGRRMLLTHPLQLPSWRNERHEVFYYLTIIAELEKLLYGSTKVFEHEPQFELSVSEERKTEARKLLSSQDVRESKRIIALCPGSTNSRAKRWPPERYAALGDLLADKLNAQVALIGAAEELDVSQEVKRLMKHEPLLLTGQTDLSQAVGVLSVVDALVTNDTGPAHIAAALGCPTFVIFGPTIPTTTRPFANAEIIRKPPDCAPCMLRDCPIDHRCMTAISPEEVFEAVCRQLLNQTHNLEHGV